MLNKKITTVYLDEALKSKALLYGINLSKFCNNALHNLINMLECKNSDKCEGPDLNRRTPMRQDPESCTFNQARQPPHSYVY